MNLTSSSACLTSTANPRRCNNRRAKDCPVRWRLKNVLAVPLDPRLRFLLSLGLKGERAPPRVRQTSAMHSFRAVILQWSANALKR